MKVLSNKGVPIDMGSYLAMNEDMIAIGNAKMNARGDIIGPGGHIVKTREQLAAEYHTANPKAVKKVSLHDLSAELFKPETAKETEETITKDRSVLPNLDQDFVDPITAVKQAESAARKAKAEAKKLEERED